MAERRIVVTRDGPYRVEGDVAMLRSAPVETEYGEPVDWEYGPAFRTRDGMELCRCGKSERKPFCDGSHERTGFVGTETAENVPTRERRETFEGDGVVMSDDVSFCTHAGFCGDRFTKVWMMIEETSDPTTRARLVDMIEKCPSGRLTYRIPPEPDDVEPAFDPSIGVEPNGPYWVRGGVPVVSEADGTQWEIRNRVTLCRCGRSRNKPFCDGTHRVNGFTDPAMP